MDQELEARRWRLWQARDAMNTTQHWKLQITAMENAYIKYFELTGKEAHSMRGRATATLDTVEEVPAQKQGETKRSEERMALDQANKYSMQARRIQHVVNRLKKKGGQEDEDEANVTPCRR